MKNRTLDVAVPIYISNLCDSECRMCSMSHQNSRLERIDGTEEEIRKQLDILYRIEGIRWVMILSGEYKKGEYRTNHLRRIVKVVNEAFKMGYERVTINIGALDDNEITYFYGHFLYPKQVGLAVFQETYDRVVYEEKFGKYNPEVPKTDYDRRFQTLEKWLEHGFVMVNPGILLGAGNPYSDTDALLAHCTCLKEKYHDCKIQVSLPRIVGERDCCDDQLYKKVICKVREYLPDAEVILTTRESKEFLGEMLDYFDVLSPGTSEVLGYTERGEINNSPDKSQFYIKEKRERPSQVLQYFQNKYQVHFRFVEKSLYQNRKQKVFISTPITNAINSETGCFDSVMASQISSIAEMLKERNCETFLAIEKEKWGKKIAKPEDCAVRDFRELKNSDKLIVYLTRCFSEGTCVEIGWATALDIPVTILCQKGMQVSPLIKGLGSIGDNRLFYLELSDQDKLRTILNSRV
ncbi:nucleoside 2-deoxyribosyltransferase [[Clostridium] polysaccharolyticum]|uniref:Radical SAM core domain-containing protein n=1 Tax=[Clostridium] polysaccharolyticum TaxID=29364 RepID=A0A1H9Z9H0_9FIRM|nr:nucleoside 2-deoxyribosyltransferase [[Clostridium] polysaccharolyticum]SES78161.1 hypothetical protein SAMN04487772_10373 [[Clostridium] polysaccharolyticum]